MSLTGDGAEVQVVPDDLLQLVVHRAFLEAQVEVVAQVLVDHASWRDTKGRGVRKASSDKPIISANPPPPT